MDIFITKRGGMEPEGRSDGVRREQRAAGINVPAKVEIKFYNNNFFQGDQNGTGFFN